MLACSRLEETKNYVENLTLGCMRRQVVTVRVKIPLDLMKNVIGFNFKFSGATKMLYVNNRVTSKVKPEVEARELPAGMSAQPVVGEVGPVPPSFTFL